MNLCGFVGNNPIGYLDPDGLKHWNEEETRQLLDMARDHCFWDLWSGFSLVDLYLSHLWPGPFDFKANGETRADTFEVDGATLNADEFGNFIAGYAAAHGNWFGLGTVGMGVGGILIDLVDGGGFTIDLDSRPMLDAGHNKAVIEVFASQPNPWVDINATINRVDVIYFTR